MEDMFEVLAEDHEEIRQMLSELAKGPTAATGGTEDQLMLRKIMTEELIIEEAKHSDIERRYLWPVVREHVASGGQLADRAVCRQLEIGELLAELDKLDAGDAEFEHLLRRFTTAALEHFDFEERHVWPRLRPALTTKLASELSHVIVQGKKVTLFLPHPRASAAPGGNAHHGSFG
jgi:hemerythrin-like domain-containing protein